MTYRKCIRLFKVSDAGIVGNKVEEQNKSGGKSVCFTKARHMTAKAEHSSTTALPVTKASNEITSRITVLL